MHDGERLRVLSDSTFTLASGETTDGGLPPEVKRALADSGVVAYRARRQATTPGGSSR